MESYDSFLASHGHLTGIKAPLPSLNGWHENVHSRVMVLSAKDEHGVANVAANLKAYLETAEIDDETEFLDSLIYTLAQRRSLFPWRAAMPITDIAHLTAALEGPQMKPKKASACRGIGFVFTGQGAQWFAMGRELIAAYPIFRNAITDCDIFLREAGAEWSLQGMRPSSLSSLLN